MGLKITHLSEIQNNFDPSLINLDINNDPIKLLIENSNGDLIPCNVFYGPGSDCGSCKCNNCKDENYYIPCNFDQPIELGWLENVREITFESKNCEGTDFDEFIRNLMNRSFHGVEFIIYRGVVKNKKCFSTKFVHHFSLYKLIHSVNNEKDYTFYLKTKQSEIIKHRSNLERLKKELSEFSVKDWLEIFKKDPDNFEFQDITHFETEKIYFSLNQFPNPINLLVNRAELNFVRKAPADTERILNVTYKIVELPTNKKNLVIFRGTALVPKKN